ncbi:AraC family transcriptional regulator [Clostridium lacusfryxellense]|uniref:AraC family transcriptional regulator n=1 Tax=Clostridium lacusfryxellense TaxID=205328 RepID=UPI001C0DEF18|nr:AraC family transcriptional regulator [Clostridium lacusfryxellense]MBU3113327.1 AraC family transcriptional regulator [Clostridium lacusfryxellense]
MICREKGVLPNSEYFFFDPSQKFKNYYYYVLNCGHFYCNNNYSIKRDGNNVPLFLYIIDGEFHLEYEGNHYLATKGDIILIDGQKPHYYYSGDYCDFIYIHYSGNFSCKLISHLIDQNNGPLFKLQNHQEIYKLANDIIAKLYYNQPVTDVNLSCAIYNCLCYIQDSNDVLSTSSSPSNNIITNSIYFIRINIGQDLNLHTLAKQANLSLYYYAHLFKKETGMSCMEYIAKCKINLAKTMLKTTQQTISEIADSLGYSSSSSFINAFSSRIGISPLKFRNRNIY